jgi:aminoglycoside phosphotransferase (APT) family kinase protein
MRLEVVGALAGGEVGATEVRDAEGRRFVLKRWPGGDEAGAALQAQLELVEALRLRGYPAPAYVAAGAFGEDVIAVQTWVDGRQRDDLTTAMVERLTELALLHGEVHVPASDAFSTWLTRSLVEGCDGYCLHEPLRAHSAQTRMLLDRIRSIGARIPPGLEPSTGIVHRDFHHRNALWRDDDLAAIIDWEDAGVGDPAFDLVTLAFGLTVSTAPAPARELPWRAAERSRPAEVLRAFAAHMALRQVDWSIRHRTPGDVEHWLRVGANALERFDRSPGAPLSSPA